MRPAWLRSFTPRSFSTVQHFQTRHGQIKDSPKLIGTAQSRGERPYQEDAYVVCSLELPTRELRRNLRDSSNKDALSWRPNRPGEREPKTQQVAYLGIYDGHGGDQVSSFLKTNLHKLMEDTTAQSIQEVVNKYREIGSFYRRFKGGILAKIATGDESDLARFGFGLDQRATLAFLQADEMVLEDKSIKKAGAVATVALLHSLDVPTVPFFASELVSLTVAHVGDTRAILCATADGSALKLTETHHPESREESSRLRRVGAGLVTDSFGESRLGGSLANSRGIGDRPFKRLGVTGEPTITKMALKGPEWAFLVLVTDGISSVMSDQEIVDLVRYQTTPEAAAKAILSFAEQVGSDDNMTVILAPLPGWNKIGGKDATKERREFRLQRQANPRQRRM